MPQTKTVNNTHMETILIIALILAVLVTLYLCIGKRARVKLRAFSDVAELYVKLVGISWRFRAYYRPGEEFYIAKVRRRGGEKVILTADKLFSQQKKRQKLPMPITELISVQQARAYIRIGVEHDAFLCAMINGALDILLKNLFALYLNAQLQTAVRPNFFRSCFAFKISGIIKLRSWQIIISILKGEKEKNNASDRKHNEVEHRADKADG